MFTIKHYQKTLSFTIKHLPKNIIFPFLKNASLWVLTTHHQKKSNFYYWFHFHFFFFTDIFYIRSSLLEF